MAMLYVDNIIKLMTLWTLWALQDRFGRTAIMYTGKRSHWRLCRRLLTEGSDTAISDLGGLTVLDHF